MLKVTWISSGQGYSHIKGSGKGQSNEKFQGQSIMESLREWVDMEDKS